MARCLVLGGSGFLGSHVVDALVAGGHEVLSYDIRPPLSPDTDERMRDVAFVRGDMLDQERLSDAVRGCRYVFHYATTSIPQTSIHDPGLEEANLIAALRLIRACSAARVEKLVFPSSGGTVYGRSEVLPIPEDSPLRPASPYAATKVSIEYQLGAAHRSFGLDYAVLRYGNPYGPRQNPAGRMGIVSVFFGLLQQGKAPTLYGDGTAVKDFFFVEDAAAAAAVVLAPSNFKIFNVGSGQGTTIRELIGLMGEVIGRPIEPKRAPPLPGDEPACVLDIGRIKKAYGWTPRVGLREGLKRTWAWVQSLPAD